MKVKIEHADATRTIPIPEELKVVHLSATLDDGRTALLVINDEGRFTFTCYGNIPERVGRAAHMDMRGEIPPMDPTHCLKCHRPLDRCECGPPKMFLAVRRTNPTFTMTFTEENYPCWVSPWLNELAQLAVKDCCETYFWRVTRVR